jgi:hypothetical protein
VPLRVDRLQTRLERGQPGNKAIGTLARAFACKQTAIWSRSFRGFETFGSGMRERFVRGERGGSVRQCRVFPVFRGFVTAVTGREPSKSLGPHRVMEVPLQPLVSQKSDGS